MSGPVGDSFEERSRELFYDSVENLDMRMRSRLTQARHAALEAAARERRPWLLRWSLLTPAVGITAAAMLGAVLWLSSSLQHQAVSLADGHSSLEDLEMVAAADDDSGSALDLLQDDIDFYDFADKADSASPAA